MFCVAVTFADMAETLKKYIQNPLDQTVFVIPELFLRMSSEKGHKTWF
jgi:hypothetical protein